MNTATWEICCVEFAFDGALIDLIGPGTSAAEWEKIWTTLKSGPFGLQAFRDGELIPLPTSVAWIMAERDFANIMVSISVGSITANCHFFGGDLEIDIDPREVTSESAFESVLALMRFVSSAISLPVFAVHEGANLQYHFLKVVPDGQALYVSPS